MFMIPVVILIGLAFTFEYFNKGHKWLRSIATSVAVLLLAFIVVWVDQGVQTTDKEVWSGTVVDWSHDEEYDEWHDPVTSCTTNDKGIQSCSTTPGYWEHHDAQNHIKTSDDGWFSVSRSPDRTIQFTDSWPNTVSEIQAFWPPGTPSASVHTYENKVQASYSIYRVDGVNEKEYPDLPEYPVMIYEQINIDRILGIVPNKYDANKRLAEVNSELNKFIPDPDKPGKSRSWKQVNIIFVNVGENKTDDYGYALQNSWKNGNKNDFVVSFSMNSDGKLNWVHAFSWSEVEILKMEVRDKLMSLGTITDFVPVVNTVREMVADKFERKEFADFNYIKIETSTAAIIIIWIIAIIAFIIQIIHHIKITVPELRRVHQYRFPGRY
jgi:hypothetical protein